VHKRLRSGAGVLVVAGALLLAACGGAAKSGAPTAASSSVSGTHITISNFMFSPMSLTVSPGATVSVTNKDSVTHTLTATGGQFDTGDITQNQTKTFRAPTKPGTYHYICAIHQYMMGTVTVK
jgi:plastocyanin